MTPTNETRQDALRYAIQICRDQDVADVLAVAEKVSAYLEPRQGNQTPPAVPLMRVKWDDPELGDGFADRVRELVRDELERTGLVQQSRLR